MRAIDRYHIVPVPVGLLKNQQELGLSNDDLVAVIKLLTYNEESIGIDKILRENLLTRNQILSLIETNLITYNTDNNVVQVNLSPLYEKLNQILEGYNSKLDQKSVTIGKEIKSMLGRSLTAEELNIIQEWINMGIDEELIYTGIKTMIVNEVDNFNYVNKVIMTTK